MKKFVLSGLTAICLFALTTGLRADDYGTVAHVDQEFVVAGKTLPAGTYKFVSDYGSDAVTIRSSDGATSAIMFPMFVEGTASDHEHLTLQQVAGVSYLREIATPNRVYVFAVPRLSIKVAKVREYDAGSGAK